MSRRPLVVATLELPHRFGAVQENLQRIDALLSSTNGLDLVLLSEVALTGYVSPTGDFDLSPFAEPVDGATATALAALARKHRVHLAGPLIEKAGDALFNALLVFSPDGPRIAHYRKRCPWYPEHWATPGDLGTPLFEIDGWKFTAAVCFDVHFVGELAPEELRAADALLFPSAWVEEDPAEDSRASLLAELAREFDLSVINANWGEGLPRVLGQGGSRILDRTGIELARAEGPGITVVTLSD